MNRKGFDGEAIYNPQGKAGEYSEWACNFYTGCSNNCEYCYCKKGFLGKTWNEVPQLKKCFKDEDHALEVFKKELEKNLLQIKKSGLFFTFTSDPMLKETKGLTWDAIIYAVNKNVPVQILTKRADFINDTELGSITESQRKIMAFGFTLTGHDCLEPAASTNMERISAMKELHNRGFRTFASVEPVIDFIISTSMINMSMGVCDLYKIGCMSGKRYSSEERAQGEFMIEMIKNYDSSAKFYLKDSLISLLGIDRDNLPGQFVDKNYNIFEHGK